MSVEKYDTLFPSKSPKRILKGKIDTALGATGVLLPYIGNTERLIERKILLQNTFKPAGGGGGAGSLFTGLQAYWKLDDAPLGAVANLATFADATGNGNTLTHHGTQLTSIAGQINNGLQGAQNGNSYVGINDNANISAGTGVDFSISLWGRNDLNSRSAFISKSDDFTDNPACNGEYLLYFDNINTLSVQWYVWDASVTPHGVGFATVANLSIFNHFVLTFNSTTLVATSYANGVLATTTTLPSAPVRTTFPFNLLNYNNGAAGREASVSIDEVGFWHVALSQALVTRLYNGGAGLPFSSFT